MNKQELYALRSILCLNVRFDSRLSLRAGCLDSVAQLFSVLDHSYYIRTHDED